MAIYEPAQMGAAVPWVKGCYVLKAMGARAFATLRTQLLNVTGAGHDFLEMTFNSSIKEMHMCSH